MQLIFILPKKIVLVILIAIAIFPNSVLAQSKSGQGVVKLSSTTKTCDRAIDFVKQDLLRRGYFSPALAFGEIVNPKVTTEVNFISENFYDYPSQRTETVVFILTDEGDGRGTSNFYNSPQLMATLSSEIISACQKVGMVRFDYFIEGGIPVGYFSDNTVRPFTLGDWAKDCEDLKPYSRNINTSSGTRELLKWGYYCTH